MSNDLSKRRNLPLLLLRAQDALMAEFRPILIRHGLTDPQWRVLRALLQGGELEPWQLCDQAWISSPSMPGILSRLSQLKLIERNLVDGDQRRRLISMTPKGRSTVLSAAAAIEEGYRRIEQRVGKARLREFYAHMDDFLARVVPDGEDASAAE